MKRPSTGPQKCTFFHRCFLALRRKIMNIRVSLLMGGLLAVASPLAANAEAVQVFAVQTAQPSVMDFRGLGTATYSNSTGTSNGITLGSTSSFNVSNNLAASKEYTGATSALVQFTGENAANRTNFQQSIGTSAGAANSISAAESTATSAHNTASSNAQGKTSALFGNNFNEYQSNFNREAALATDSSGNTDHSSLIAKTGTTTTTTGSGSSATTSTTSPTLAGKVIKKTDSNNAVSYELEAYTADEYAAAKTTAYDSAYSDAYSTAYSSASSESFKFDTASSLSGVVKGDFLTINTGGSSISQTTSEIQSTATESANAVHGSSFTADETITVAAGETKTHAASGKTFSEAGTYTVNADGNTQTEWQRDYDETYNSVFASAATGGSNSSASNVVVEGIGNIANVGTQETSMFQVDLMARNATGEATENGTASGSSSATLNTVSNANVTSSQFASAFIQSFAPNDIPDALLDTPAVVGFGTTTN